MSGVRRTGMDRRSLRRRPLATALALAFGLAAAPAPGAEEAPSASGRSGGEEASGSAEEGCAHALARRVQSRYESVRDLSARFAQTTQSVALGEGSGSESRSTGEVVFAKPGKMRWRYGEPDPSVVVSDGETLWIYDPELQEVQRHPVEEGFLSGAAVQFLLGQGNLLETFEVSAGSPCDGETVTLELLPREDASYERLQLRVERESGAIRGTTVVDLFGNRTEVTFEDVRTNTDPADSLFEFEPPEDARVLELPDGS